MPWQKRSKEQNRATKIRVLREPFPHSCVMERAGANLMESHKPFL